MINLELPREESRILEFEFSLIWLHTESTHNASCVMFEFESGNEF